MSERERGGHNGSCQHNIVSIFMSGIDAVFKNCVITVLNWVHEFKNYTRFELDWKTTNWLINT